MTRAETKTEALRPSGAPCVEKPFRIRDFLSPVERTMAKAALLPV